MRCDETVQRERLVRRGATPETAAQRMAAQDGFVARVRPVASRVIDATGSAAETRALVEEAFDASLERS